MAYILEINNMKLRMKDEDFPIYQTLEDFLKKAHEQFKRACIMFNGLQGLVYFPSVEVKLKSSKDFGRLVHSMFGATSYTLQKRGKRIVKAWLTNDAFEITYMGDTKKAIISPKKNVPLDVIA